jgi:starch synthase
MISPAIYYHPEAYTISGPKLMGRNAAGESFLRGFLKHHQTDHYWLQVQSVEHAKHYAGTLKSFGIEKPISAIDQRNLAALSTPGLVYYPGPGIGQYAWQRSAFGHHQWSLCGITHTTSSALAMDSIVNLLEAPVMPWDAVICTSQAVKENVSLLLQAQIEYLKSRLGISKITLPQLPVIPLGIHSEDFVFNAHQKNDARNNLKIAKDRIVVLFMGRLSFHAKAHPLVMYQALQAAAQYTKKKITLIECGWHANDFIEKAYSDAAKLAAPDIEVITLDGRDAENRNNAWAVADIFCSLSDNIQETFGIVPIEANAAGLPVIVSDWDGYKDTVRDGIDGFRVPTAMPQPGLGGDLAIRHALEVDTYDMYCGHTCSLISVDLDEATKAFVKLIESPELRKRMGEAGKERVKTTFDWKVVIGQYEALWGELDNIRNSSDKSPNLNIPWPARMDPFLAFKGYPTHILNEKTLLILVDKNSKIAIERAATYRALAMVNFAKEVIPSDEEIRLVLEQASPNKAKEAITLLENIPQNRKAYVLRGLGWLLKLGILKIAS